LDALQYHPDGMRIDDLAAEVHRTPAQVREVLLTYYTTEFATYAIDLMWRSPAIEFVSGGEEDDLTEASVVRLVEAEPGRELGVAYASVADLARRYRDARDRLVLEPDNETLRSAADKLRQGLLPGIMDRQSAPWRPPVELERARAEWRRVAITYARAWHPGVIERVVEPYRLVRTRRGWELDAGPLQDNGKIRTYLLSRVQRIQVLDETFEQPADLEELLRDQRTPTRVEVEVPHEARWAVEKQAESVEVVAEDETSVRLRAQLLMPVDQRVGLIMIDAGTAARVIGPDEYADAGTRLARTLLAHHRGP
jgi:hypothetical protein